MPYFLLRSLKNLQNTRSNAPQDNRQPGQLLTGKLPPTTIATQEADTQTHPSRRSPTRTTASKDNCHPGQLPPGQLPTSKLLPRTTATYDNFRLKQLPTRAIATFDTATQVCSVDKK